MQAFVVGDSDPIARLVRQALLREGHVCPADQVLRIDGSVDRLLAAQPDLVIVGLNPLPDRAIDFIARVRSGLRCPIVAVGSTADARFVIQSLRAGAGDYVEELNLETELASALLRLRSLTDSAGEAARTVAVLAPSGGSGSSTLAANVATVLAGKYKSAMLVDLKLQSGDLAAHLDLKAQHTLAELCQHAERIDRSMLERSLAKHTSGVHLLAPPRNLADAASVTAEGVRQALALGRSMFPFVIIDVDHSFAPEQIEALRAADTILLVIRLDFPSLRNANRTLEYLKKLDIPKDRVNLIVNRYGQSKEVPAAKAEEALGIKIAHYIPEDPTTVNRAINNGVPVVLERPSAKVAKSLTKIAASVNGRKAD